MINMILDDASDRMQKAIEAYQRDLATASSESWVTVSNGKLKCLG